MSSILNPHRKKKKKNKKEEDRKDDEKLRENKNNLYEKNLIDQLFYSLLFNSSFYIIYSIVYIYKYK